MIEIFKVDEPGVVQDTFSDIEALHALLAGFPVQDSCCLRFIDPYGDTTFNHLQIPVLAAELRTAATNANPALRQRVEALAAFIDSALNEPHSYVKFVGD